MKKKNESLLCDQVTDSLNRFFADMNGEKPRGLYDMVMRQTEKPLLQVVMQQADRNQTRAAEMLGINRSTLRKKLRQYGIV